MQPGQLTRFNLAMLMPHLERVAELFVDRGKLQQLKQELRSAHGRTSVRAQTIEITIEADVSRARIAAKDLCEQMGSTPLTAQKVATVVSELARNIVEYTPGGQIELLPTLQPQRRLLVRATDTGTGIRNLQEIMSGQYKSKTGLGAGLRGSKRLVDRFDIDTQPTGTRIEAEVAI
jgi:serine/threonine-protein kinase RsbT